ncbi:hypothetical protein TWF696_003461 [Orbilia brochopaga]|uniref:Uncharacterized protein n=1 Tax=Orbilia brochopaga TaxID=3140254 RepID=A0AAV9TXG6_9PEZI
MASPIELGMTAVLAGAQSGGAQAMGTDRMSIQRDWLDRALTAGHLSPEEMRTFLISTVDLIYDQATEISFRTAVGLLEQPVLDRLRLVTQEDWVYTEAFSEYSWPSHGLPLLKIFYRFPKFAGRFGYELQEGVFECLFPGLEAVRAFLRKVICAVQFMLEDDGKEAFSASVVLSLSVFAQVLKIVLKRKPEDLCNIREMVVRLILLLPRLAITEPREREEVRRDAKALAGMFGLTDDIRIQATGDLKFHFSKTFFNLPCPAGFLQECHFGDAWCCLKHQDESFEQARDRVLRMDSTKAMERAAKEAERVTSQKDMRQKRDRKAIERCLAEGIEIPSYLRHYGDLIQRLKEERGLEVEAPEGEQPAVPVASKQKIESLISDSSSISTASNATVSEADLIDLLGDIIPAMEAYSTLPANTKSLQHPPVTHHVSESLLDDFVPLEQFLSPPPPPLPSQVLVPLPNDENLDIWESPLFKEPISSAPSTELSSIDDDLLSLAKFYCEESQAAGVASLAPSLSPLLPGFPDLPTSEAPTIPRRVISVYEPSIFDLSDDEAPDLGPILQPTPRRRSEYMNDLRALNPRAPFVRPPSSLFSFYDDSSDSDDSTETVSPVGKADDISTPTQGGPRIVKLACGHFRPIQGVSNVTSSRCLTSIRRRHPVCHHGIEVECGFDIKQIGFKCDVCGAQNH